MTSAEQPQILEDAALPTVDHFATSNDTNATGRYPRPPDTFDVTLHPVGGIRAVNVS